MNSEYSKHPPHLDPLLRPCDAARRLGINTETLRRWMLKGVIDYVEVGPYKHRRIRQSQVDRQLNVPRGTQA